MGDTGTGIACNDGLTVDCCQGYLTLFFGEKQSTDIESGDLLLPSCLSGYVMEVSDNERSACEVNGTAMTLCERGTACA